MGWKIAICDDDAGQAARLQSDVTDWAHGACAVTCFPSAEAFRFAGDTDWDILLLDVEMPGMSGIDLAKRLRGADFFRTHRSYLVNLKAVVRIGRTSVLLRGGAEVPLARGKYDAINRAFIDRN